MSEDAGAIIAGAIVGVLVVAFVVSVGAVWHRLRQRGQRAKEGP